MYPSEHELHLPLRHLLAKVMKNSPFGIGAGSQFSTRANGEITAKGLRHLALCHRAVVAPPNLGVVF